MFCVFKLRKRLLAAAGLLVVIFVFTNRITATEASASVPTVYLTFDDGPSANTEPLLDTLRELDVKASFFITLQQTKYLPLCERAAEEGHLLCAHTASHDFGAIYKSEDSFFADISLVSDYIESITGKRPEFIRFAGGSSNTVAERYGGRGIMDRLKAACGDYGYIYIDWNVDTGDALANLTAREIAARAVKGAKGKQHAVILMHDGAAQKSCAEAVQLLVLQLREMGYSFATLDSLPVDVQHLGR